MLKALKAVHDEILTQISALEAAVGQASPSRDALSNARWRLMRASRKRLNMLENEIYPALGHTMLARIEAFRADDAVKRAASAVHIAHWNIDRIVADWSGYQEVSAAMTAAMRQRVADEQTAFYGALGRLEAIPSGDNRFEKYTRLPRDTAAGTPR